MMTQHAQMKQTENPTKTFQKIFCKIGIDPEGLLRVTPKGAQTQPWSKQVLSNK